MRACARSREHMRAHALILAILEDFMEPIFNMRSSTFHKISFGSGNDYENSICFQCIQNQKNKYGSMVLKINLQCP